jgi:hypothetical protein
MGVVVAAAAQYFELPHSVITLALPAEQVASSSLLFLDTLIFTRLKK